MTTTFDDIVQRIDKLELTETALVVLTVRDDLGPDDVLAMSDHWKRFLPGVPALFVTEGFELTALDDGQLAQLGLQRIPDGT